MIDQRQGGGGKTDQVRLKSENNGYFNAVLVFNGTI